MAIKKSKFTKKKLIKKPKRNSKQDKLIANSLERLDEAKKRYDKNKGLKLKPVKLSEVISLHKDIIKKLIYKSYLSLTDKQSIVNNLFIYYIEHEEFREYCKQNGISHYFLTGNHSITGQSFI